MVAEYPAPHLPEGKILPSLISGKLLYAQWHRAQSKTPGQGNASLPCPGPVSASPRLPQPSSPRTELAIPFLCSKTLQSSLLSTSGVGKLWPRAKSNLYCFCNGILVAPSHTYPFMLFTAALGLKGQTCVIATKPKMFTIWLFGGR